MRCNGCFNDYEQACLYGIIMSTSFSCTIFGGAVATSPTKGREVIFRFREAILSFLFHTGSTSEVRFHAVHRPPPSETVHMTVPYCFQNTFALRKVEDNLLFLTVFVSNGNGLSKLFTTTTTKKFFLSYDMCHRLYYFRPCLNVLLLFAFRKIKHFIYMFPDPCHL